MSDLEQQFKQLLADVKNENVDKQPTQQEKLMLYAWYKQATQGDAAGEMPGDFVGKVKFQAWQTLAGMSRADAMQAYIDFFVSD